MNPTVAIATATATVQSAGLPWHDVMSYVDAGVSIVGFAVLVFGLVVVLRRVRELQGLYRQVIDYLTSEEKVRAANRADINKIKTEIERKLREYLRLRRDPRSTARGEAELGDEGTTTAMGANVRYPGKREAYVERILGHDSTGPPMATE